MKVGFYTLGCKVNQYETQAMEQMFQDRGFTVGSFSDECDAYLINTCSVTAVADKKNRGVIRRCRREHPGAVIGVCGCYTQHAAEQVAQLDVDVIGGSAGREAFVEMVVQALADGEGRRQVDQALRRRTFEALPPGGLEERTRAMLKVQDGCVNFCTYCIIPYTRGPVRSAPLEVAVEQSRELAARGYREIVVTGIEIASWGVDLPGKPGLAELVEAICRSVPACRIRLGSLEPRIVTDAFCARLAELPNLCPQFHLSMQSGSDSVLARMGRKYDTARYLSSVELLRRYFPGCGVTTDMIVAFPGETEAEFGESLAFIRRCAFADMHIFPYSRRPGTPADTMPGQHSNETKERRSREAIAVAREMHLDFLRSQIGTVQQVLFEQVEGEMWVGHAPNYCRVWAQGDDLHNRIRPVRITALYQDGLQGELLPDWEKIQEDGYR